MFRFVIVGDNANLAVVNSRLLPTALFFAATLLQVQGADLPLIKVDFSRTSGVVRALHGVNKGPLAAGGTIDLTESYRSVQVPFIRLHDCQWPYPEVVDIHSVFRDSQADPAKPDSYDFALTDEYLAAVHQTGARIIYRLGESIEHMDAKRFVHPPGDPKQWSQICLGIIRHYNEGWAKGFRYNIEYFEIWNEPENRPAMWTGSEDQFLLLYRTAARDIKAAYPHLNVGGPGFGYTGKIENGKFIPSDYLLKFLRSCREDTVPLDFFSWHCYTDSISELLVRAKGIREVLDSFGFSKTKTHLTEWNYLPDSSWAPAMKSASAIQRRNFFERMAGDEGASFLVGAMIALQDAPVDVSCIFHGELGAFGLFDQFGVEMPALRGLRMFSRVAGAELARADVNIVGLTNVWTAAVTDRSDRYSLLLSNRDSVAKRIKIEMSGFGTQKPREFRVIQQPGTVESRKFDENFLVADLPADSVILMEAASVAR